MIDKIKSYFAHQTQCQQIRNLNILLAICAAILIGYSVFIWQTTDVFKPVDPPPPQIILVHTDNSVSNILSAPNELDTIITNANNIDTETYLQSNKDEVFQVGDVVIIKFFEKPGVVIKVDAPWEKTISVMYSDENKRIHIISLDRKFLVRAPAGMIHLYKLDLTR